MVKLGATGAPDGAFTVAFFCGHRCVLKKRVGTELGLSLDRVRTLFNVFFLSVGWGLGAKMRAKSAIFAEFDTLYLQICVSLV